MRLWIATLLVLLCRPAWAGIVNLQSVLAVDAEEGLSGALTGSADWRTGNTDLLVLSLAPLARYRHEDQLVLFTAKGELGRSKGERIIARTFEHLRYRYGFTDRVIGEVFGQHEYDEFRRLELRALIGAGPKLDVIDDDALKVALGVAYMLEYERLNDSGFADDGDTDFQHRISSYLVAAFSVDDRVQLAETVYAQPRLTEADDIRLLSDTALTFRLTESLAFATTFSLAWDNAPPIGVEELDTALKSSLTYAF